MLGVPVRRLSRSEPDRYQHPAGAPVADLLRRAGIVGVADTKNDATDNESARAEILWKPADAVRGQIDAAEYKHVVLGLLIRGFCKAETADGIGKHGLVLTPGQYVGAEVQEDDGEPCAEKYPWLLAELEECVGEGERLMAVVREGLKAQSDAR